jgi:hypothetical protein
VSDFFDFSLYLDADEEVLRTWYIDRFFSLRATAFQDPRSYFHRYATLSDIETRQTADRIWESINLANLRENVLPTRQRANLILRKGLRPLHPLGVAEKAVRDRHAGGRAAGIPRHLLAGHAHGAVEGARPDRRPVHRDRDGGGPDRPVDAGRLSLAVARYGGGRRGGARPVRRDVLLMAPVMALFAGLYLDDIAELVERRDYPQQRPGTPLPTARAVLTGVRFGLVVLAVNLALLPTLLLGIGAVAMVLANAYLLGREYFEMVATRHMPADEARRLRKENAPRVLAAGFIPAFLVVVPL